MATEGTTPRSAGILSSITFDIVLAAVLTCAALVEAYERTGAIRPEVVLITLLLPWRRTYPLMAFGVVALGALVGAWAAQYVAVFCLVVSVYSVGAYSRYRLLALVIFVGTGIVVDQHYGGALPEIPQAAGPFLILFPFWLIGIGMRTRQLRADAFEDKAERLEREQEQAMQLARAEERSRIARELHDVVAHSVSVMVVQAGAARQVLTQSPEQAREALLAVEASGREAMTELRNLLGLLSQNGDGFDLAPQPGIDQLDTLIRRVSGAGLPVEFQIEGSPFPLPVGLDLTAYRIVQEALTNALKYSGLARTRVILDFRGDELKLEILDEGMDGDSPAGSGPGRGLVGMRERVAMYGGRLEAGKRLNRGYAVRAWLPRPRTELSEPEKGIEAPAAGTAIDDGHPVSAM